MNKDFDAMISSYLEGVLSLKEQKIFEDYMKGNLEFSTKVNDIKNIINLVNQTPKIEPSKDFLNNLESNISKKSILNHWFIPNFKTSFSFTFAAIALFFIIFNDYNVKQEVIADKNFNNQSLTDIEADTLKNDNFLIKQVKSQKHSK
jgi:hypothetical protein